MAKKTLLEVEGTHYNDVIDALAQDRGYRPHVPNQKFKADKAVSETNSREIPNPISKEAFVKEHLLAPVKQSYVNYKARLASTKAQQDTLKSLQDIKL